MTITMLPGQADQVVQKALQDVRQSDDERPVPLKGDAHSIARAIQRATGILQERLDGWDVSPDSGLVTRESRYRRDYVVLLQREPSGTLQYYIAKPEYTANLP